MNLERRSVLRDDKGIIAVRGLFWRYDSFMVAAQYCIGATGKCCRRVVAHCQW